MNTLFVLDLDGTLADASRRFAKAGPEPKKRGAAYTKWLRKVQTHKELLNDKPIPGTRALAHSVSQFGTAVYITARSAIFARATQRWLVDNAYPGIPLVMRPKRNRDSSGILKERIIRRLVQAAPGIEHVVVFDDDPTGTIEEACHRNGWTFFKARSGGY